MLRPVRLRIYVYAHLNVRYIDYNSVASYETCRLCAVTVLPMIKFSMHKRVRILDSEANVKGRILQSAKMLDKLSIYKTEIGPSWHGPSFASWAEFCILGRVLGGPSFRWAELVLGRVVLHPVVQCMNPLYDHVGALGTISPRGLR